MPTSYTSLLGLALPVTGELSGTWGDTVNDYITQYLDAAVAGAQTISGSQTAVTLSKTTASSLTQAGSGSTGSSQYQIINCTGNPAGLLTITVPAASKAYLVLNSTSTSQSVKVVGAGPTTGVTMVSGEKALIAWDGSDFVKVASSTADGVTTLSFGTTGLTPNSATAGAITVAGTLVAANGGTGQSSYTTGDLLYATGSTALSKLGIGTNGQILTSTGTAPQWSTLSGVAVTTFSAGTTGFTPSTATSGAITLAGTLATTNGGTGLTSFTANGVVYASSTSALTTGSALTFDGTNLSVGGSNSQQRLNVVVPVFTTNASGGMRIGDSANNYYVDQLVTTDGSANPFWDVKFATHTLSRYAYGGGNNFWAWYANNTEQMRLTSTGLGIGTSSPTTKLYVTASVASTAIAAFFNTDTADGNGVYIKAGGANAGKYALAIENAAGSSLAYLDSSGNLGLGVTPSAWGSTWRVLDAGNLSSFVNNTGGSTTDIWHNAFVNSGGVPTYKTTAAAGFYRLEGGTFKWFNASSGTAGTTATFTQAMTLDANSNLLTGGLTSYPGQADANSTANGAVCLNTKRELRWNSTNASIYGGSGGGDDNLYYHSGLAHIWRVSGTERARITSGGALLINRTAALGSELLSVNGTATATDFNSTSDRNKKTNITTIESAVEKVKRLRGVEFDWIADGKHSIGVIAQEVEEVIPSAVQGDEGNKTVSYGNLVGLLIEAIKEQQQVIDQLRSHINPIAE